MMRTWKLPAFVAAALLGFQTHGFAQVTGKGEAGDKGPKTFPEKVEEGFNNMAMDVGKVKNDVAAIQKQMKDLAASLDELRSELRSKKLSLNIEEGKRLDSLEDQIKNISGQIAALDKKLLPTITTIAKSPPAAMGRLLLVNAYTENMLFVINQRVYSVRPYGSLSIEQVPAGPVTFELVSPTWGAQPPRTATVNPGEMLTLTAR